VPFPFSAGEILTATNLNNAISDSDGTTTIGNAGPGAAEFTVQTLTMAAPALAGRVHAFVNIIFSKTVGTDRFGVSVKIDGNVVGGTLEDSAPATTTKHVQTSGSATVDTSGTVPVVVTVARTAGTGTATVTSLAFHYIFIPTG